MIKHILLNGVQTSKISIQDRGLQYGDGLFETMRVQHGQIIFWAYHWQRLQKGCMQLAIPLPDKGLLEQEMNSLVSTEPQAVLKLILTRGKGERGYVLPELINPSRILMLSNSSDYPMDYGQTGICVYSCKTQLGLNPVLAGIKHLNRLEQVLARNEWQTGEYQEGLLQDIEGHVIEGTMSNIFWVKNKQLFTPDLSRSGVEGVMRKIVMELAKVSSISINIGLWSENELFDAEEIFIVNSLIGIWPVSYIFNRTFPIGPVTQQLQFMLQAEYDI